MKVKMDKKLLTLKATGNEKQLFTLIAAFAGDAVIYPKNTKSFLEKLSSKMVDKLVIDLTHESISKEFVQLVLRLK